jgi:hypothetical protein
VVFERRVGATVERDRFDNVTVAVQHVGKVVVDLAADLDAAGNGRAP